jgi:outer membrane lipoprotein-sorting protein
MTKRRSVFVLAFTATLFGTLSFGQILVGAGNVGSFSQVNTISALLAGNLKQSQAPICAAVFAPRPEPPRPEPQASANSLDKVLAQMDQQAANFRNAQANFAWDQYTVVVDDHDLQEGVIYFRHQPNREMQMSAEIMRANGKPIAKVVLFADGMVKLYEPKIDRVTEYDAGKNKAAFESFLVLGFGGGGHDMLKSFDVKYQGTEKVQGVDTAKLELTPKSPKVRAMFNKIILWIDPARGVSVQQQFFDPDGNYRLAKYNNIKLNEKINDDVFKLKTTSHTTTVRPGS